MPASAQRACGVEDLIAEMGGGIDPFATVATTFVDGKLFVEVSSSNRRCRAYLGKNNAMVEYIRFLGNEKVHKLMLDKGNPRDVYGDGSIPPIIRLDVATASSMVASVNVRTSRRMKGALEVEVTRANMELLLEQPAVESPTWHASTKRGNVHWHTARSIAAIKWWDSEDMRWR